MYDVEKVISARIQDLRKDLNPQNNQALVRSAETAIMTLQNAPRDEAQLQNAIRRLKTRIEKTDNSLLLQPLYAERDALQWLLIVVRLKDSYHTEDGML